MAPETSCCTVFELRQYTLRPGRRDELIELFERDLVEPQEDVGMRVAATFRDRDDADRFVWLRGFEDMSTRDAGLRAFYLGPVWAAARDAANATMLDSDDVLLLKATDPPHPFPGGADPRAPAGASGPGTARVEGAIYLVDRDDDLVDWLAAEVQPLLERVLEVPVVTLRTDPSENSFPQLPIRGSDNAFVWIAAFHDEASWQRARARLADDPGWSGEVEPRLAEWLLGRQSLRLTPTARSAWPVAAGRA